LFTFCHQTSSIIIIKTKQKINQSLDDRIQDQSQVLLSPPHYQQTTTVEKKRKKGKKNEWCYLLLTYVLHCKRKKKKQGQVHQTNAVKAEPDWPPICVSAVQRSQHFLNFRQNITTNIPAMIL